MLNAADESLYDTKNALIPLVSSSVLGLFAKNPHAWVHINEACCSHINEASWSRLDYVAQQSLRKEDSVYTYGYDSRF